ncbi:MAG: FAD/NAD(P)-binding oxidoreductase [Bacteroidota bacterium]
MQQHIVIIGNGISGVTAARHIRKRSDHRITMISKETDYFFSRTALMYIYMGHMKFENTQPYENWFWEKNKIDLMRDEVKSIDFENKKLSLGKSGTMDYTKLVLAVGSKPNKFGWPGQDLKGVTGMYSAQDLETIEQYTDGIEKGVIVGGGLIGIELAEMLHSQKIDVSFLVRESSFWNGVLPAQESEMINKHIYENHIDLQLGTELKEILPDDNGRVRAIITSKDEEIPCQFVGLTAGVSPNTEFLKGSPLKIERGIVINEYMETNVEDVYAIGDCAQHTAPPPGRRPVEQVWYTGRMMGEVVGANICGEKIKYNPGPWFNSAKFFDIEYQTYGTVLGNLQENETDFYWEHEDGKKCVHAVYDKDSKKFIGLNNFGLRLRHEIFDKWLEEERDIYHVIENLGEANFDPEFFDRHEEEIIKKFNSEHPEKQLKSKYKKSILQKIFA